MYGGNYLKFVHAILKSDVIVKKPSIPISRFAEGMMRK
jgi:hypothetical protein